MADGFEIDIEKELAAFEAQERARLGLDDNREQWTDAGGLQRTAELFREAIANAAERNMTFGYHNHDFEMTLVEFNDPR